MADMTLYLGNKNYSSWSLRAWLALKASGLEFDEVVIPLYEAGARTTLMRYSPSGHVPVLHHDGLILWESLAIGEYVAELAPQMHLLPPHRLDRAAARAIVAEMNAGYRALRNHLPMNIRSSFPDRGVTPEVQADINRITSVWRDRRREAGDRGPFLFGEFTLADAAFAPVVSRFRTYKIELDEVCQRYADAVWALPMLQEWVVAAGHEPMIVEQYEF